MNNWPLTIAWDRSAVSVKQFVPGPIYKRRLKLIQFSLVLGAIKEAKKICSSPGWRLDYGGAIIILIFFGDACLKT